MPEKWIHVQKHNRPWSGTMGSHYLNIFTAWVFAAVPMSILAVAFVLVVEDSKPKVTPRSFYTDGQQTNHMSLGSAIYSQIPSTQLTFIASFSATLATALLPASMALYSYTAALNIAQDSDSETTHKLPSAYQLEIVISTLNGSLLALWSFATYLCSKGKRVAVIPILRKAALLLGTVATLAVLIAITDAWLNFSVSTVQYTIMESLRPDDSSLLDFAPGRGLHRDTLNPPSAETIFIYKDCDEQRDSNYCRRVRSAREYADLITNSSKTNRIVSRPEGTMILPTDYPTIVEFMATTFGSLTSCKVVTDLCDFWGVPENITYRCTVDKAGVDLNGVFQPMERNDFDSYNPGFSIRYYTKYSMPAPINTEKDLIFAIASQVESGLLPLAAYLESYQRMSNSSFEHGPDGVRKIYPTFGFVPLAEHTRIGGILSCSTSLSDVSYTFTNNMITQDTWTSANATGASVFLEAADAVLSKGSGQLQQGMRAAVARAKKVEDIASAFAKAYDQTILSLAAGDLVNRPPSGATRATTLQVTRIPHAPFITLIVLDIAYAALGTGLMIAALIALRKAFGVRDAQVRLSTLAVIAESFESPVWGDDAKNINMLFAERRGESPRRIALTRREGGRRFKQIVTSRTKIGGPVSWPLLRSNPVTPEQSEQHRRSLEP